MLCFLSFSDRVIGSAYHQAKALCMSCSACHAMHNMLDWIIVIICKAVRREMINGYIRIPKFKEKDRIHIFGDVQATQFYKIGEILDKNFLSHKPKGCKLVETLCKIRSHGLALRVHAYHFWGLSLIRVADSAMR